MSQPLKSWVALTLVCVLALATGFVLRRPPRRGGDLLDAAAAVQRRAPRFLVSEPGEPSPRKSVQPLRPLLSDEADEIERLPEIECAQFPRRRLSDDQVLSLDCATESRCGRRRPR